MGNQNQYQQTQAPYQGNLGYRRGNNAYCGQGWRPEEGPSNRQNPYQNYKQNPQPQDRTSKMEDTLNQFMKMCIANQKSIDAAIKNLENQVGQIVKQLVDQQGGTFTVNTQTNPRGHSKSILTWTSKEIGKHIGDNIEKEQAVIER